MVNMPGTSDGRMTPASSLSGLPSGTTSPGCGAVNEASCRGAESAADGLVESGGEKRAAHGDFRVRPGQRAHAFSECRQRVGKAIVAVDARYFFDEVDLAFEIEPPTGQRDGPGVAACLLAQARQSVGTRARAGTFSTVAAVMPSASRVVPRMRRTSASARIIASR